jgi:II/X family phage/plasmid replication protein
VIDWIKVRYPIKPDFQIGDEHVYCCDRDGAEKWHIIKPQKVRGSFETGVHAKVDAYSGELLIDGNPSKFFQGHNAFGSGDMRGLVVALFESVARGVGLSYPEGFSERLYAGEFRILATHLTQMYAAGSRQLARAMRDYFETSVRVERTGRGERRPNQSAVYYRKHSRRLGIKVYPKGDEVKAVDVLPGDPRGCELASDVLSFVDDKLRIEFVLRSLELRSRGLDMGTSWCDTTADEVYASLMEKLEFPSATEVPTETLSALKPGPRLAYEAWREGRDVSKLVSRASFYRYRAQLLPFGIDIAMVRDLERASNVVPLVRVVELKPVGVPAWALGTSAYFDPRKTA